MGDRVVLHCDCNSFFASVELLHHPEYRDFPMAVAGDEQTRTGIILAKNEPAKKLGVATAETIWQARKKCPDLILVPPRHDEYSKFSKMVNNIYLQYTDLVEPFGIDESWLDVTGSRRLFGTGEEIAESIRCRVKAETGLTVSIGVSFNKIFAKLGSDYKKPDAVTVISRENFRNIVWEMPVGALLFAGENSQQALQQVGIHTVGQLALANREMLNELLGKMGQSLWEYSNGIDESPVLPYDFYNPAKSVGNGVTLPKDISTADEIRSCIISLCEHIAMRLRRGGFLCTVVHIALKDPQFRVKSKQKHVAATDVSSEIAASAAELAAEIHPTDSPVRAITVTASGLEDSGAAEQLMLTDEGSEKHEKLRNLEQAKDRIREKYGGGSIRYGKPDDK